MNLPYGPLTLSPDFVIAHIERKGMSHRVALSIVAQLQMDLETRRKTPEEVSDILREFMDVDVITSGVKPLDENVLPFFRKLRKL